MQVNLSIENAIKHYLSLLTANFNIAYLLQLPPLYYLLSLLKVNKVDRNM